MIDVEELYRVRDLPAFQNRMYASRDQARSCARGDVVLVRNRSTGLVYNEAFRPELVAYDAHYQNEQGNSPLFMQHLEAVADLIAETMGSKNLVEVGCGKGRFLELLQGRGADICGYDPTYEGGNPRVIRKFFSEDLGVTGDGLILRHVLEHIQDPVAFLDRLRQANGGGGKIYIEVPCFDWICERRTWFDIFYEHVNYFRLSDFHRMFGEVHEAKRTFGGQYLSVVAELGSLRTPVAAPDDGLHFPADFTDTLKARPLDRAIVWGGASKGVLFCLMMERAGVDVECVVDINPAKQGLFLPATGVQVQSPAQVLPRLPEGATIYVMNSNYLPEIRDMSGNQFNYVGVDHE